MYHVTDIDRLIIESGDQPAILFETHRSDHPHNRSLLFLNPLTIVQAIKPDDVAAALRSVDEYLLSGYYAAGYVAYETGYSLEPSLKSFSKEMNTVSPLLWFGIYDKPLLDIPFDLKTFQYGCNYSYKPDLASTGVPTDWMCLDEYKAFVGRIKEYISSGDTYQINFTGSFRFTPPVSTYDCYRMLTQRQRVSYAAYISHDDIAIISLSPELFFRTEGERIISRPMKGTMHRGRTVPEDARLEEKLRKSVKDCAENVMIVDLIRNDFGKVCVPGSISVPELFTVEKYDTILQMTSTVEGQLKQGTGIADVFFALFPCGSVTGAPKIRSMQIIRELETQPRGIYTGAIGYAGPKGESVFSVAIRTAVIAKGQGTMGIGSGIVWDSDPESEYEECAIKRRFFENDATNDIALIETMRCSKGRIRLISEHIDRIIESASYFEYPQTREKLSKKVCSYTASLEPEKIYKIRLLLHRNGDIDISGEEIVKPDIDTMPLIAFAPVHSDSGNRFIYHKTTHRPLYNALYDIARRNGLYDIILKNERGEITEGCISNIFVKIDGVYITPPVESGLLNGVMRRHIMKRTNSIIEKPITFEMVQHAERIIVTNAVRGIREVAISDETLDYSELKRDYLASFME